MFLYQLAFATDNKKEALHCKCYLDINPEYVKAQSWIFKYLLVYFSTNTLRSIINPKNIFFAATRCRYVKT